MVVLEFDFYNVRVLFERVYDFMVLENLMDVKWDLDKIFFIELNSKEVWRELVKVDMLCKVWWWEKE